jgi:hypothetical protein
MGKWASCNIVLGPQAIQERYETEYCLTLLNATSVGLEGIQRWWVVCPFRKHESLSIAGIRNTIEDITRRFWTPD